MKILRRHRTKSRVRNRIRNDESGVIIVLVAVIMLGVVGAMAALSIDVVTLYTARSEAQLAADGAALAGARTLANSGATSDTTGTLMPAAQVLAQTVALQVAERNQVGGAFLTAANVTAPVFGGTNANPTITVKVQVTNLPAFFARIWGGGLLSVTATATAEAYNPSGGVGGAATSGPPVAPICVKPWLIPNMDPTSGATPPTTIFDPATGAITNPALLGYVSITAKPAGLPPALQNGNTQLSDGTLQTTMGPWKFYPGDTASTFAPPTQGLPACNPVITTAYQQSVAGCIPTPVSCNSQANLNLSIPIAGNETSHAVNCLAHSRNDKGDISSNPYPLAAPFEFIAGDDNPVALAEPKFAGEQVMTSDSLVTVPVFNNTGTAAPPTSPVQIIGFVQLFVNPDGLHTKNFNSPTGYAGYVTTQIVNMVGCGTAGATGTPILGNGASPVAVRLISP
jgi:Flp pilus assembly protein TadG